MIHFHDKSRFRPTICEVRGVERQPAAQVLINPPAGLEEIFTLWIEGKRSNFQQGHTALQQQLADVGMPVHATYRKRL